MRRLLNKFKSELFLRLGLAGVYLYSGWSLVTAPAGRLAMLSDWPAWTEAGLAALGQETFLQLLGSFELALGGLFLMWFMPGRVVRWAACAASVHLIILLSSQGLSLATFPLIGLIGLSLGTWSAYRRRL